MGPLEATSQRDPMPKHTYKSSGVDLDAVQGVKALIKAAVASTHGPEVLSGVGAFGAMFQLSGYEDPVLVSSTDGVGTKLKLAAMMNRFEAAGEDLVNACVNDVIVCGAKPLFFLDYIGMGKLDPEAVQGLVQGMVDACRTVECALIGGETAQLPGLYSEDVFDLVGFAVGVVERSAALDPSAVQEGDVLIGIPSNGLHTNGYSLVRHIFGLDENPSALGEFHPELERTLGETLLLPHRSYYRVLRPVYPLVKAMAHITGGGLVGNMPRVLPKGLAARFDTASWDLPPIFPFIQKRGDVADDEMYRVFNMGLGMVLVAETRRVEELLSLAPEARVVGQVIKALGKPQVIL